MGDIRLTDEQKLIVNSIYGNDKIIKIEAGAGSGKTFSMIELVKEIRKTDKECRILYMVFNRNMIDEAKLKFDSANLDVDCYSTYGFALKRFTAIKKEEIIVKSSVDFNLFMKFKNKVKYKKSWIQYKTIVELFNAYCLSFDKLDVFVKQVGASPEKYGLKERISSIAIELFKDIYSEMISNNEYLHGMYLKAYACEEKDKIRGYKYVIIDECADSGQFLLNIVNRIECDKKYFVGDTNQAIYGFLRCVNAFKKYDGLSLSLSTSFRFNDEICKVANDILSSHFDDFKHGDVKNSHNNTTIADDKEETIIFRRNSTLFQHAISLVGNNENDIKVIFLDTVNGKNTAYFDDTFSEMIYFYFKLLESIDKDRAIEFSKKFRIVYSKQIETYVKIASKENKGLFNYLTYSKKILPLDLEKFFNFFTMNKHNLIDILEKVRHSENIIDYKKCYLLISLHRAKGLEWSNVTIPEDAWSLNSDEEVRILYTAVTRAMHNLNYEPVKRLLEEKMLIGTK